MKKMSSKGQGLSLNTIVIAAIVLVVLFILLGITTGYFGSWTGKFKAASETSCKGSGGKIVDKATGCNVNEKAGGGFYEDVGENKVCCIPKGCGEVSGTACKSECDTSGCRTQGGYCETEYPRLTPSCGSRMKCCGQ